MNIKDVMEKINSENFKNNATDKDVENAVDDLINAIKNGNNEEVKVLVQISLGGESGTKTVDLQDFYNACESKGKTEVFRELIRKTIKDGLSKKMVINEKDIDNIIRKLESGEKLTKEERAIIDVIEERSNKSEIAEMNDYFIISIAMLEIAINKMTTKGNLTLNDMIHFFIGLIALLLTDRNRNTQETVVFNDILKMTNEICNKIGDDMLDNSDPLILLGAFLTIIGVRLSHSKSEDIDLNIFERFLPILKMHNGETLTTVVDSLLAYTILTDDYSDVPTRIMNAMTKFLDDFRDIVPKSTEQKKEEKQEENSDSLTDEEIRNMMKKNR